MTEPHQLSWDYGDIICWEEELARLPGFYDHPLRLSEDPAVAADMWRMMYRRLGIVLAQYAQIEDGLQALATLVAPKDKKSKLTMGGWVKLCRPRFDQLQKTQSFDPEFEVLESIVQRRNRYTHGRLIVGLDRLSKHSMWEPVITIWRHEPTDHLGDWDTDPQAADIGAFDFDFDYGVEMTHCRRAVDALVRLMKAAADSRTAGDSA